MKGLQFPFSQCFLATHPAVDPEEDPVIHRLPAETIPTTPRSQKNALRVSIYEQSNQSNNDNTALQYSPEMPFSFQPRRELPDTSPFNKRREDTTPRKYVVKPYEAQIEVKVLGGAGKMGRTGNSVISVRSEQQGLRPNRQTSNNKPFESITYEESKVVKQPKHSFVKKLNFDLESQNTTRQGKESSVIKPNPIKGYELQEGMTLDRQVEELRGKLAEMENLNASLRMQYQIGREKLAVKESENQGLKDSHEQLSRLYEESNRAVQRYLKMEVVFIENKNMMGMFCDEIGKQKETIDTLQRRLQQVEPQLKIFSEKNSKWQTEWEAKINQTNSEWKAKLHSTNFEWETRFKQANSEWETKLKQTNFKWEAKLQSTNSDWQKRLGEEVGETGRKWELRLKQETDAYQLLFDTQERDATALKDSIKNHQNNINQLSQQISSKVQQIRSLQGKLQQTERLLMSAELQNRHNEQRLRANEQRLRTNEQRLRTNEQKLGTAVARIGLLEYQENDFKRQIQELNNRIRVLQQVNAVKQKKINSLHREVQQQRKKHENQIGKLNNTISEMKATIQQSQKIKQNLQESLDKANLERDTSRAQVEELKQAKAQLLGEIDTLNKQISALAVKIKQQQQTIVSMKADIERLNSELYQLQSTILQFQQHKLKLQRQIYEITAQITIKEQQISRLKSTNNDLTLQSQSKISRITELQQKLPNYDKVIASYKESMQQLKITHQKRWQQLKAFYEEQFAGLQDQLKEFSEAENSKRSFRNFKKQQLAKQTTTTTTTTVHSAVLGESNAS